MKFFHSLLPLFASTLAADSCNPLKQSGCDANKALGASIMEKFSGESKYFSEKVEHGVSFSDEGVRFRVAEKGDNPSIMSNFYMMFGKVEVVMKAAPGKGIVTSFFLQSDDLDEIDIELLGADTQQWQSNFFSKGNTTTYDRGDFHNAPSSLVDEYHTYTIEFTQDTVTFALDGTVVRTLDPKNPQGFPQTPMRIFAGSWAGGDPSNPPGTIEWAGGLTDYSKGPYDMHIKSIIAVDYSSGSEYKYSDQSGGWSSIEATGGEVNGRKTQAQSEFESLKNGEEVSAPPASEFSASVPSSSASSDSQKMENEKSSAAGNDSESMSSGAASAATDMARSSQPADVSSQSGRNARSSTMVSSTTSRGSIPSVSQVSAGGASSASFGIFVAFLTFIGYLI